MSSAEVSDFDLRPIAGKHAGELRTHPPTAFVDDDIVPSFAHQLAGSERGGRQMGKDVGNDLERNGSDRRGAGNDAVSPLAREEYTPADTETHP